MILMRHGQSEFNLHFTATRRDPGIPDPRLTPDGQAQAVHAASVLRSRPIRRVIVSPYTRALQTAAPIIAALGVPEPVQVHVSPLIRERFHFSCDIGTQVSQLAAAWPAHDFSHIDEVWWPQETETGESTAARAQAFRAQMANDPLWRETLVVSHWAFILTLTGQSLNNGDWTEVDITAPAPETLALP